MDGVGGLDGVNSSLHDRYVIWAIWVEYDIYVIWIILVELACINYLNLRYRSWSWDNLIEHK
jgi:hypothetical protein